ncbi:MAG: F0F1 ATP synthase subunit B [Deltaproteobacteria bacterium]|nr:F0F1 ATP synthase subunit B [Deltaproteobacteria bacterium]
MLINWFTVAAQIVNFLILVALLKRFLYGSIVAAMTAREGKIAAQLTEARQKRQEAEQEEASLHQKSREIEDQRQEMLTEAGRQAEAHKKELFSQARQEVEQIRQKWAASLKREKETFLQNLKQRLAQEVFAISRRTLKELGNLELEQRLTEVFLDRLRQLAPEEQTAIRESVKEAGGELLVTTAFELPEETREKIAAQVQDQFGRDLALRFATSGELLAGIELLTSSRKLAWSLGGFLDSLEEDLSQAFHELEKSEAA